ncbi:hypothetical protein Q4I30_001726 [Leishmania utingensis]|uniref:Leucine-rich repeat protein n=1 Tax=Leishmania utingensis TaxID=653362 RepID=A0AAW3AVL6_9TRYP
MQVDLQRRGLQSFDPAEFANTDEHLNLLLQVRQLDLSHNSLCTIRGLEGLTHLTVLNISHNGLRSLGGGLPLTLRELDASHNSLVSLQNAALLPLQFLTSLNVSFNDLEDLRGVPSVTARLTYLDARSNRLSSLVGIEHCSQLRTLHAEANLLREVADVASIKCLPLLSAVFLSGNPLLLRKRLFTQLRLLLPSNVEQDDLPTTAPPSSLRSSTAAPPSVPDTSSVGSLDHTTVASVSEYREEVHSGSGHTSQPASTHQGTPPSMHDAAVTRDSSAVLEREPRQYVHSSASRRHHHHLPYRDMSDRVRPSHSFAAAPPTTTGPTIATGVVGGASDSPTCPRRPLPHEHRLAETPGTASMSSSPDHAHATLTPGPLHSRNSRGSLAASLFPVPTSPPHEHGTVVTAPQPTRYGDSRSSDLARENLEVQLVRVTAERDHYRREVVALRKELGELRQKCAQQWAHERTAVPDGLEQRCVRSAVAAAPVHGEGNLIGGHSEPRQSPQQQQRGGSPPGRILAVEMSAHSSFCSHDGEGDTPEAPTNNHLHAPQDKNLVGRARASLSPLIPMHAPQQSDTTSTSMGTSKMNRRKMAALFMAKLQQSGPSSR